MPKEVVLHIGLHKTGTTSIQHFLQDHRAELQAQGVDFYQGMVFPENHVELHVAAMRPERESGYKNRSKVVVNDEYIYKVRQRIRRFIRDSPCEKFLFSNEGLSLLRHKDEIDRLCSFVQADKVKVIVFLRAPEAYLASYASQLMKHPGTLQNEILSDSFAYTGHDSWLTKYEERLEPFKAAFGPGQVAVEDYDDAVLKSGTVLPKFLECAGVQQFFCKEDWIKYRLNVG